MISSRGYPKWKTCIAKEPIRTLLLSPLRTATIGAAHSEISTGSNVPAPCRRVSSLSTRSLSTYGTDWAGWNLGSAVGSTYILAVNPLRVPNPSWNTEGYLSRTDFSVGEWTWFIWFQSSLIPQSQSLPSKVAPTHSTINKEYTPDCPLYSTFTLHWPTTDKSSLEYVWSLTEVGSRLLPGHNLACKGRIRHQRHWGASVHFHRYNAVIYLYLDHDGGCLGCPFWP